MLPLRIGSFTPAAPVVLAPMAGVTNAAFRTMCRSYAPDLVYVNEMVMATAVVYRNDKTLRMMTFGPDERPRSLQIYGSDPDMLGREMARLQRSCRRLIWLNPLLGAPGYQPLTRGMQAALRFVDDFLPAHNITSLEALAMHLQGLSAR